MLESSQDLTNELMAFPPLASLLASPTANPTALGSEPKKVRDYTDHPD